MNSQNPKKIRLILLLIILSCTCMSPAATHIYNIFDDSEEHLKSFIEKMETKYKEKNLTPESLKSAIGILEKSYTKFTFLANPFPPKNMNDFRKKKSEVMNNFNELNKLLDLPRGTNRRQISPKMFSIAISILNTAVENIHFLGLEISKFLEMRL